MQELVSIPFGYISAVEAAKRYGFTNDYIARLCRKGKVEGTLLYRMRFVSEASLQAYLLDVQAQKQARKDALSKQIRALYDARAETTPPAAKTAAQAQP